MDGLFYGTGAIIWIIIGVVVILYLSFLVYCVLETLYHVTRIILTAAKAYKRFGKPFKWNMIHTMVFYLFQKLFTEDVKTKTLRFAWGEYRAGKPIIYDEWDQRSKDLSRVWDGEPASEHLK